MPKITPDERREWREEYAGILSLSSSLETKRAALRILRLLDALDSVEAERRTLKTELVEALAIGRGMNAGTPRDCTDCGRKMVWTSFMGESWMCPHCVCQRMVSAEAERDAARAALRVCAEDFRLVNESGMWQGHPFTITPQLIIDALAGGKE